MPRSNALLRSLLLIGLGAGVATAVACVGGGGPLSGDELDASRSSSSSSSSGSSGIGTSSSSSGGPTGPTEVPDTFSHACNTDDDCTLAFLNSSACGFCNGANAAIAKSDQAAYQTALNQARANCPPNNAPGSCAAFYNVSQCNASKQCQFVSCGNHPSVDEHHCAADGG